MSGYRGHLVGGLVTFVALRNFLIPLTGHTIPQEFVCLILTLLGALFPDVDIKSKGQQVFYSLALVIAAMAFADRAWNSLAWLLKYFLALQPGVIRLSLFVQSS